MRKRLLIPIAAVTAILAVAASASASPPSLTVGYTPLVIQDGLSTPPLDYGAFEELVAANDATPNQTPGTYRAVSAPEVYPGDWQCETTYSPSPAAGTTTTFSLFETANCRASASTVSWSEWNINNLEVAGFTAGFDSGFDSGFDAGFDAGWLARH